MAEEWNVTEARHTFTECYTLHGPKRTYGTSHH